MNLVEVINERNSLLEQEKKIYLTSVNQINSQMKMLLTNDYGSQFIKACGRDLAGELVRTYFDTSDYNVTVDQMVERIFKFSYNNEYDPLGENGDLQKLAYNYNDRGNSETLQNIMSDLESSKVKLFDKESTISSDGKERRSYKDQSNIQKGKEAYRNQRNADGAMKDDYSGRDEAKKKNSLGNEVSQLDVEHTQSLSKAYVYSRYLKEGAEERIKEFYNSSENFAMMDKTANQSKGDVPVFDKNGNDITFKASPEQITDAVVERWETSSAKAELKSKGYLDENGKVPKSVKVQLVKNYRNSQNKESKVILKETDYKKVAGDAKKHTVHSLGKIVAGQVMYYTMPPLLYEIRLILKDKNITLDNAMEKLDKAKKRICKYIISKLSAIFKSVFSNGLKKFIKSFLDILINMVKATVQKILKLAKNLVLSVVDAIKIIGNKNATPSQKADSVFNIFAVTITTFAIEVIFEYIEHQFPIPEPLLLPLQTITTVVCTNFVMLILQRLDLFDVKYGLLLSNIENVFDRENELYLQNLSALKTQSQEKIDEVLNNVQKEIEEISIHLKEIDVYSDTIQVELEKVNEAFNMDINFEKEWQQYIGVAL